jgi:hypothetical protein
VYFYLHIFCRLICRRQMMAKCTPQTFRRGHAPTSMSLPRLTSNSVGCCVPQLNGGYLRPRPHPPLSYFSSIYFDDRTDDTAHPQVFRLSRASSLTPPSSLTPILFDCCVLIYKKAATFKAQASPIPLFFDPSLFAPLNKQTNDIERKPDGPKAGRALPSGGGSMAS